MLVVDDQASLRSLIRLNLELEGYEVVEAADGVECLERARERRPDVITLDVVMPRMDGLAAAAELHADPELSDVPVIIVTTSNHPSDLARARAAGVGAYLTKPYHPDELVLAVRDVLGPPT